MKLSGKMMEKVAGKMVVKCLPTFTFHFPARIGAMAPALALMPLGGSRPAQRTGTDRNDARSRDTYDRRRTPARDAYAAWRLPGDPYVGATESGGVK